MKYNSGFLVLTNLFNNLSFFTYPLVDIFNELVHVLKVLVSIGILVISTHWYHNVIGSEILCLKLRIRYLKLRDKILQSVLI